MFELVVVINEPPPIAAQGTEASCPGTACVTLGIIETGAEVRDGMGNACGTHAAVVNTVPQGLRLRP